MTRYPSSVVRSPLSLNLVPFSFFVFSIFRALRRPPYTEA